MQCKALSDDMQYAFVTALLDQLEDYGADVKKHHRRLRTRQPPAKSQIEAKHSLEIQSVQLLAYVPPSKFHLTTPIDNYVNFLTHIGHGKCIYCKCINCLIIPLIILLSVYFILFYFYHCMLILSMYCV